ncbi:protein kinase [Nonomuraea sp. NPDC046570]|uniref:protein kinase domain-containing protein n=1 Tax=Nonomuraea sp. NPDC046570 TaxID=3155255 RepID=UPI0033D269AB
MADLTPLRNGDPQSIGGWRLLGRLGMGGQGVVYLGQSGGGERIAVKLLHTHLGADPKARKHLVTELAAMRRVAAFCTARVLFADLEGDRPYIVSEYVEGPSLHEVVSEEGPRGGSALVRLAVGTATALSAIHQAGVVHRDFKPGNVLLGPDGPRVIDFGIAKVLDLATAMSTDVIGTPAYMAPEQLNGEELTAKIDVFAWACTIVYAATGRPPFGNESNAVVLNRVLNLPPSLGSVDGALRDLLAACLAKDPRERPSSREVLLDLLDHAPPQESGSEMRSARASLTAPPAPPPATPPGAPPPLWRRRRVLAALVGTAAVAAGTVAVLRGTRDEVLPQPRTTTVGGTRELLPQGPLPGVRGSLNPDPAGPLLLTSYLPVVRGRHSNAFVLDRKSGTFEATRYRNAVVSPSLRHVAGVMGEPGGTKVVTVEDRDTGRTHRLEFDEPVLAPVWSPVADRLLVTLLDPANPLKAVGYAIASGEGFTPKVVRPALAHVGMYGWPMHPGAFAWNQDGTALAAASFEGDWPDKTLHVYTLDGALTRTYPSTGANVGCPFSPDGKLIATQSRIAGAEGEGGEDRTTLFDVRTGTFVRELPANLWFMSWYGSAHVIGYTSATSGTPGQVRLVGVDGTPGRTLITNEEVPADWNLWPYWSPR